MTPCTTACDSNWTRKVQRNKTGKGNNSCVDFSNLFVEITHEINLQGYKDLNDNISSIHLNNIAIVLNYAQTCCQGKKQTLY